MDKEYYQKWRAEKDPSFAQEQAFQTSLSKFYGADDSDSPLKRPLPAEKELRKQEILKQTSAMFTRSDSWHNPDKRTVGVFYEDSNPENLTKEEMMNIEKMSRVSNTIFRPNTYQNEDWKIDVLTSTTHAEHCKEQFNGEEPDKKFNLRRTVISEYSNALHNQTVFINPKFTSC
ncbi:unnamed protein product [Blepharisma stoltei]|uniref:Uncharacterized protein n=1 Tax=Blepharisma stoltei TaxID=1481888 RepID=A0AAU9IK43_9CILI|nr:unnamed protein product [Blepharisma stoltei]